MLFSNLTQTTILNILNAFNMMRMTYTSFMQFMEMLTWACYEAFGHHGGTKGVPRQRQRKWCHGNISMIRQLIEMSVQKKVWMYGTCKRWWGDPGYRVPTGRRHGKRGGTCKDQFGHGANTNISYNKAFVHGRRLGVIPSKHAFSGRNEFNEGGSGTRAVGEVVIHVS